MCVRPAIPTPPRSPVRAIYLVNSPILLLYTFISTELSSSDFLRVCIYSADIET